MKRKLLLFLIISLVIFLPSCASSTATIQYAPGPQLKICTTISPIYAITADVVATREKICVEQIIPPTKNIEEYNIGDEEYKYYSQFNMVIINGMGLDNQIAERLKNLNPNIKICDASLGIDPIIDENGEKNQKIWSSPLNQLIMYQNIANAIMEIDKLPPEADKDGNNYANTIKEYKTRFAYIEDILKNDITVEKSIAPKADLQNLKSKEKINKEDKQNKESNQEETNKEKTTENIDKLQIEEETKNIILEKINIKTSKTAFTKDDSFDYLLRDCSIQKSQSAENSIEIGSIETDIDSANKCLLTDIMKQKEIMPNTAEKTSKYNITKLKLYFGENKK